MSFPNRFRIWDSRINGFHKPADEVVKELGDLPFVGNPHPYVLEPDGGLMATNGYHIGPCEVPLDTQFILEWDTGIVDSKGKHIYEGDIVSFTIRGYTHGPEADFYSSAQVWWCRENACWALGKWEEKWGVWWCTFQDRIMPETLLVLGNVHENLDKLTSHPVIV